MSPVATARDTFGQHGHGAIDPDPGEERRDLDDEHVRRHPSWLTCIPSLPAGRPKRMDAATTITPTVMQASATLKVGQWLSVMKSATRP